MEKPVSGVFSYYLLILLVLLDSC